MRINNVKYQCCLIINVHTAQKRTVESRIQHPLRPPWRKWNVFLHEHISITILSARTNQLCCLRNKSLFNINFIISNYYSAYFFTEIRSVKKKSNFFLCIHGDGVEGIIIIPGTLRHLFHNKKGRSNVQRE